MKIKLINFGVTKHPKRAHYNDAGLDVFAKLNETINIEPHTTYKIPLGFGIEIPDGYVGYIFPRSSLSSKGLICELAPIDSGYRGEIHAIMTNHTDQYYTIHNEDKVGQLVILPCILVELVEVLDDNKRGTGAFGSTGNA